MDTCERCFQPITDESAHGLYQCPFEPRPDSGRYFQDHVPGGFWVENMTPTPMFFESHSAHRTKMKDLGLVQKVRHVGAPGSDKNPNTTRWV